jgi:hypothetical protein
MNARGDRKVSLLRRIHKQVSFHSRITTVRLVGLTTVRARGARQKR